MTEWPAAHSSLWLELVLSVQLPQQEVARTPQRLSLRLPLPQQLARGTPQRQIRVALLLPQQLARVTPQRPEQRSEVPEHRHNDHEAQKQGGRRHNDRWQLEEVLGSSISAPPRFPAACKRSDPSERTQPYLLAPSSHQEVLEQYLV